MSNVRLMNLSNPDTKQHPKHLWFFIQTKKVVRRQDQNSLVRIPTAQNHSFYLPISNSYYLPTFCSDFVFYNNDFYYLDWLFEI